MEDTTLRSIVEKEVNRIRNMVVERDPFFAARALSMDIVLCEYARGMAIPTAATDGERVFVNPEFFRSLAMPSKITVFAHEVLHSILGHQLRRGGRMHYGWNVACDHEVNNILRVNGYEPVSNWICDTKYEDWYVERIYYDLYGDKMEDQSLGNDQSLGSVSVSISSSGAGGDSESDAESSDSNPEGNAEDAENAQSESSRGEQGKREERVGIVFDALNPDGSAMSRKEKEEAMNRIAREISFSSIAEKSCGTGTGYSSSVSIQRIVKSKNDWKHVLRKFITGRNKSESRTRRRLDRRQLVNGLFMPARKREGIDWIVYAVDVSGSMSIPELEALNSEMEKIRKDASVRKITVVPFDSGVRTNEIVDVTNGMDIPTEYNVGGGTAFSPVMKWVSEIKGKKPSNMIIFTDLCCSDYGEQPIDTSILWVSTSTPGMFKRPPFGQCTHIEVGEDL